MDEENKKINLLMKLKTMTNKANKECNHLLDQENTNNINIVMVHDPVIIILPKCNSTKC